MKRRECLAAMSWSCWHALLAAQEPLQSPDLSAARWLTSETQTAIQRGLDWLQKKWQAEGGFGGNAYGLNTGVVALGGMAFLCSGSTSGRGPYGKAVKQVRDYLRQHAQQSGLMSRPQAASHGPMYEHGFATLFLAELYGMDSEDDELRETIAKAVKLIITAQNKEGGWRYEPRPQDADLSVTICQVMALRAAKNAGFYVPNDTIDRCIAYVKKCQNADGGFMYMATAGGPSHFPRSAAGVVALHNAGVYEGKELERGLEYLLQHLPGKPQAEIDPHEMYGQYYAVQAMWQAGGKYWDTWYPAIRDQLLARQKKDGSWSDAIANEYATAMACIVLQMPNNVLPIFQR